MPRIAACLLLAPLGASCAAEPEDVPLSGNWTGSSMLDGDPAAFTWHRLSLEAGTPCGPAVQILAEHGRKCDGRDAARQTTTIRPSPRRAWCVQEATSVVPSPGGDFAPSPVWRLRPLPDQETL